MITSNQQRKLAAEGVEELWNIIQSSLHAGMITQFDKLLKAFSATDNPIAKHLAQKLNEDANRSGLTSLWNILSSELL